MALTFPQNPTNGQIYGQYIFESTSGTWKIYDNEYGLIDVLAAKANLSGGNTFTGNQAINSGYLTSNSTPHISGRLTGTSGSGLANSFTIHRQVGISIGSSTNITVPVSGVYAVGLNTISSSSSGRVDAFLYVNGALKISVLTEDNGSGYHQKSLHAHVYLAANDYVSFGNNNWYDSGNSNTDWKTFYVTLIS